MLDMTPESLELIVELAYTAGIIDGEGTISIGRSTKSDRKNPYHGLFIAVSNTAEWLLQWLQITWGGNTNTPKLSAERRSLGHKQMHVWSLNGQDAADFLVMILPYLQLKRPQAELGIKFQSKKNQQYDLHHRTIPLAQSDVANREADYILMLSYNKKGLANA